MFLISLKKFLGLNGRSMKLYKSTESLAYMVSKWPPILGSLFFILIQTISIIAYTIIDYKRGEFDPSEWYYVLYFE